MAINLAHLALVIDSPLVQPNAQNFRPPTWPPTNDFPIVINAQGKVISRYGDAKWDLRAWAKKPVILYFDESSPTNVRSPLTSANADLLRQITAWWLYGPTYSRSATALRSKFYKLRSLFSLCSALGIIASDLRKYPAVLDEFRSTFSPSEATRCFSILHHLYEQREELGFTLLDRSELIRFEASLSEDKKRQTPYIPPRIWAYQVNRLRLFLDDFHAHHDKIVACYMYCLDAYSKNAGTLGDACRIGRNKTSGPFWSKDGYTGERSKYIYCGPFSETAKQFGIDELLKRWTIKPKDSGKSADISVRSFAKFFTMVSEVGLAYILNFSLMRVDEASSLRSDCLNIEYDELFGSIYILCGPTTKTITDDDARWPTSPSVKLAVDAMACVAKLRMICAEANPDVPTTSADILNPRLVVRSYEPWGTCGADEMHQALSVKAQLKTYLQVFTNSPSLFDLHELQITQADVELARLVTPSLDENKFGVSKTWPLAWHQLRRTGAVNMQASGLISDASLQYLLKHSKRAMSLYYGQGYSRVRLNGDAQGVYIRTMYEMLSKEIANLFTDRFLSPHGEKRKNEILKIVDFKDSKKLTELAKNGKISWRETLLGGCTKRGPCPYGGVDNVAHCGGGDGQEPCADVLYDRNKVANMRELGKLISKRLAEAPQNSPDHASLEFQQLAVAKALNVIENY